MPRGPTKRRRVVPHLRESIAGAASEGQVARSGAKALAIYAKTRGWLAIARTGHANTWTQRFFARYWCCARQAMAQVGRLVCSTAWDATRLGGGARCW